MEKDDNWYVGTKVKHEFNDVAVGMILEHRDDSLGYSWLVRFTGPDGEFLIEDWYKADVLEEIK